MGHRRPLKNPVPLRGVTRGHGPIAGVVGRAERDPAAPLVNMNRPISLPPLNVDQATVRRAYNPPYRRVRAGESPEEAERRLAPDIELHLHLAVQGFDGKAWSRAERVFVDYARTVVAAMIRDGRIFDQVARVTVLAQPPRRLIEEEVQDLTMMSVAVGVRRLKTSLKAGKWNPGKGASLTTSAVNKCTLAFIDEYKAFYARTFATPQHLPLVNDHPAPLVDDHSNAAMAAERWLRQLPARSQTSDNFRILTLISEGHTQKAIAEHLGMSEKAVEGRMRRIRQTLTASQQVTT